MSKRRLESSVTTIELGSGKKPSREKPLSASERVDQLPKVTLKRRTTTKPPSIQDLELRADRTILE